MPELPEVQTTATSLAPLIGQTVVDLKVYQPKLRFAVPDDLDKLIGSRLVGVRRRAKYLLMDFVPAQHPNQPQTLLVHLGMSGSLQQHPAGFEKRKHDHVIIEFCQTDTVQVGNAKTNTAEAKPVITQLHYHDPRRFGMVLWHEDYHTRLLEHLGVEPLDASFDADYLHRLIHRTQATPSTPTVRPISRPIKAVIMEQAVVVGVGNIYATEALFLAGIHPATPAHLVRRDQLAALVGHIKTVLQRSIEQGGSTLRDFTVADGKTGYFQQTLLAYGRQGQPCVVCGTPIESVKIAQRASSFCPRCQPRMELEAD